MVDRGKIVLEYKKYLNQDLMLDDMSKELRISVSAIQKDLKFLGINKKPCRKHLDPVGCCRPGYKHKTVYSQYGTSEWRRLGV